LSSIYFIIYIFYLFYYLSFVVFRHSYAFSFDKYTLNCFIAFSVFPAFISEIRQVKAPARMLQRIKIQNSVQKPVYSSIYAAL